MQSLRALVQTDSCRSKQSPPFCDHVGRCLPCGAAAKTTYELVQSTIFDSPRHGCNGQVCHGSSPGQGMLDLRAGTSYAQMLNVKAVLNPELLRIKPGSSATSYALRKIYWAATGQRVAGGGPMPTSHASASGSASPSATR